MHPICALVVAGLCISARDLEITSTFSTVVVMKDHGFNPEAVKRRGVEIDAMESDSFHEVNPLFMDHACSRGWCLNYTRHCDNTVCKFEVTGPYRENAVRGATGMGASFEIHARTKSQLRHFMNTLTIALTDRGATPHAYMPLSRLKGGQRPMFRCSSIVWYEGCYRPRLPMKPRPDRV